MAFDPREVAVLLALDSGLKVLISPQNTSVIDSLRSGDYVTPDPMSSDTKSHLLYAHGSVHLTPEGKRVVQIMKNTLAEIGMLDSNEVRYLRPPPKNVTPKQRRIGPT